VRGSPALLAVDALVNSGHTSLDAMVRTLVELIARTRKEQNDFKGTNFSEEVLVDTEVDGSRYLLVRMPKPNCSRIQLSPREQEIVKMVARGHPNKVIADVLSISMWTVCTHLRRVFAKLGVGSRAAMVAQLLEMGILDSDHPRRFSSREDLYNRRGPSD